MPESWTEREALLLDVLLCTSEALHTAPTPGSSAEVYAGWFSGHRAGALAKVTAWDAMTAGDGRQRQRPLFDDAKGA